MEEAEVSRISPEAHVGRQKLSAFVVTFNEEKNIGPCLSSLHFCDELVVVDSHSTDATREIAHAHKARVIERAWPGYLEQKKFASESCAHEWVLFLDADERATPELQRSIEAVLSLPLDDETLPVAYEIQRVVFFLGRWWRHAAWPNEYRLRLFRRGMVSWGGGQTHERVIAQGKVARLQGELEHYSFKDLKDYLERLIRYASLGSREYSGPKIGLFRLFWHPLVRFCKVYFLKRSFLEGVAGLIIALSEAFYAFLKYAIIWESQNVESDPIRERQEKRRVS
jgi:glycosyltransferase involved in cell wall biosynthesis